MPMLVKFECNTKDTYIGEVYYVHCTVMDIQ